MNNEVLKAMKTRRSIRKYKPEQITDEQLDAIGAGDQGMMPERMRLPEWENSLR